jgi:carboxyl-terminal processing protease
MAMTPSAHQYLERALSYMQDRSVKRGVVDWPNLRHRVSALVDGAESPEDTYPAIREALHALGDRHSWFIPADRGRQWGQSTHRGFGLLVDSATRMVIQVHPGSPASAAGLQPGDLILAVGGQPVEASEKHRVLPLEGETVVLQIHRREADYVESLPLHATEYAWHLPPRGVMLSGSVGYLELPELLYDKERVLGTQYACAAHEILRRQADDGARGWVVDLRRNTGGDLDPMIAALGPLLGEGLCFSFVGSDGERLPVTYRRGVVSEGARALFTVSEPLELEVTTPPVAGLIGPFTISAGEFVTLALHGRANTRLLGQPTFGVPTRNDTKVLDDGAVLFLTIDLSADRNGEVFDSSIPPDESAPIDWVHFASPDDPAMVHATRWIGEVLKRGEQ